MSIFNSSSGDVGNNNSNSVASTGDNGGNTSGGGGILEARISPKWIGIVVALVVVIFPSLNPFSLNAEELAGRWRNGGTRDGVAYSGELELNRDGTFHQRYNIAGQTFDIAGTWSARFHAVNFEIDPAASSANLPSTIRRKYRTRVKSVQPNELVFYDADRPDEHWQRQ